MTLLFFLKPRVGSSESESTKGGYSKKKKRISLEDEIRLKLLLEKARLNQKVEIKPKKEINFKEDLLDDKQFQIKQEILKEKVIKDVSKNYTEIDLSIIMALVNKINAEIQAFEEVFIIAVLELDED